MMDLLLVNIICLLREPKGRYASRLEVYEKLKASGIDPEKLQQPLSTLNTYTQSLHAEPITLGDASSILPTEGEEQAILDLENEQ